MTRRFFLLVLTFTLTGGSALPAVARASADAEARLLDRAVPARAHANPEDADGLLVRYRATSSSVARASARATANVARVRGLPAPGWELVDARAGQTLGRAAARLAADPAVAEVVPDRRAFPTLTPTDTFFSRQWALHNTGQAYLDDLRGTTDADVDALAGWDTITGSSSTVVAVIDTGVAYDHADLSANIWANPGEIAANGLDDDANGYVDDVRGWDWVSGDNNPYDVEALDPENGEPHGTHVAGIIGARGNDGYGVAGVGWSTKIMPLRVLGSNGGSISDIIDAMSYAAEEGADVVNLSLGATGSNPMERQALNNLFSDVMDDHPDTLFVAAAGNETANNETNPMYPCAATSANLLCVAATDDDDALAEFSSYGATSVDLAAPGDLIISTAAPGYLMYMSGTSMATPMVAGAAALLYALAPDATVGEVRNALLVSGDAKSSLANKTVTGRRLNVANALIALVDPPIFADVPLTHGHYADIQTIYPGITSGCGTEPLRYCPSSSVTRGQMAVFLVRAMGIQGELQPYAGVFADVPSTRSDARYIELLHARGITGGCQASPATYCPGASITRAQMAVFLLRGMDHADLASYQGVFSDVPAGHPMASFIEHLADHSITGGCGGGKFCPASAVTRAQMATFLVRAFGLS